MTAYDRLRASALDPLAESLPQQRLQPEERSLVTETPSASTSPCSWRSWDPSSLGQPLLHDAAGAVANAPAVQQLHLGPNDVERALTAVFVHGVTPTPHSAIPRLAMRSCGAASISSPPVSARRSPGRRAGRAARLRQGLRRRAPLLRLRRLPGQRAVPLLAGGADGAH